MFLYLFIVYRIACDKFFGRKNMCCPPWLVATAPNLPHSPKKTKTKKQNLLQLGDLCCTLRLRLRPAPGQIDWMPFGLLSGENKKCCEWALSNWYGYEQAETETQLKTENQRGRGRGRPIHSAYLCAVLLVPPPCRSSFTQSVAVLNSRDELLLQLLLLLPIVPLSSALTAVPSKWGACRLFVACVVSSTISQVTPAPAPAPAPSCRVNYSFFTVKLAFFSSSCSFSFLYPVYHFHFVT